MNVKLSKAQWNYIGKQAGWLKEAQMPAGQSPLGQQVAVSLNSTISKLGRPDLESQARNLASQLVALFDQAAQQEAQMNNPQQPQ